MNPNFKNFLLKTTNANNCHEAEVIQSLWSGYGKISRYHLKGAEANSVVVKYIALNQIRQHPRGWNTDLSHQRKVKSYEVETLWYQQWNHRLNEKCKSPKFIGSYSEGKDQWIVLEDLNNNYPLRKYDLNLTEVKACLNWLANFHGNFLNQRPEGLWEVGTYWHLDTRPDEFKKIENQELKSKASPIDQRLNNCKYQTIVHGDAKLANFCFSENGLEIAAVDFQYVGGGCGMKDVAYFLGSCLTSKECELNEKELLADYFLYLKSALDQNTNQVEINFSELEKEWRLLYPYAITDFTRFLMGWMPTHQKVNDYHLKLMNAVLTEL